jgi:hypothetical protein
MASIARMSHFPEGSGYLRRASVNLKPLRGGCAKVDFVYRAPVCYYYQGNIFVS